MTRVKFGIRLPVTGPLASAENILKIAKYADELGYDAVTTHDHVVLGFEERYHNSGGLSDAIDQSGVRGRWLDVYETMVTLALVAGRTDRVRLIPCAAVLPWRQPILFGKQALSLHELSGGRFVCSVVVGNMEADFEAMNVDFKKRGRIMDEYLEVLSMMLSGKEEITFEGESIHISGESFLPAPSKPIPLWIGGGFNEKTFERLVKYGDGFLPGNRPIAEYKQGLDDFRTYLKEKGVSSDRYELGAQTFMCLMDDGDKARKMTEYTVHSFFQGPEFNRPDPSNVGRSTLETKSQGMVESSFVGSPSEVCGRIERYVEAGSRFFDMRQLNRNVEDIHAMMKLFATDVMPSFI